jgi:hypothetical protein
MTNTMEVNLRNVLLILITGLTIFGSAAVSAQDIQPATSMNTMQMNEGRAAYVDSSSVWIYAPPVQYTGGHGGRGDNYETNGIGAQEIRGGR